MPVEQGESGLEAGTGEGTGQLASPPSPWELQESQDKLIGYVNHLAALMEKKANVEDVPSREQFQDLSSALAGKAEVAQVPCLSEFQAVAAAVERELPNLAELVAKKADVDTVPALDQLDELRQALAHKPSGAWVTEALRALEERTAAHFTLLSGELEKHGIDMEAFEPPVPAQEPEEPPRKVSETEEKVSCLLAQVGTLTSALNLLESQVEQLLSAQAALQARGGKGAEELPGVVTRKVEQLMQQVGQMANVLDTLDVRSLEARPKEEAVVQSRDGRASVPQSLDVLSARVDELSERVRGKADTADVPSMSCMQQELGVVERRLKADIVALISRFQKLLGVVEQLAPSPERGPPLKGPAGTPRKEGAPEVC